VKLQFRLKNGETHEIAFAGTAEIHRAIVVFSPKSSDGEEKEAAKFIIIPDDVEKVEVIESTGIEKGLGFTVSAPAEHKETEIKTEDSVSNIESRKPETVGSAENRDKELQEIVEIRSQVAPENREESGKTPVITQPTPQPEEKPDPLLTETQQSPSQEKTLRIETAASNTTTLAEFSDSVPKGCPHFFGYLRYLPKGSLAPDDCFSCPIMVDCYAIDRKSIDRSLRALGHAMESDVYGC
jgi:hypothetical protein